MGKQPIILIVMLFTITRWSATASTFPEPVLQKDSIPEKAKVIWEQSDFQNKIDFPTFLMAIRSYYLAGPFEKKIIVLIDFRKPSTKKRLYVIDLKKKELLFHTLVAHGKNTGVNEALDFSNQPGSLKSSLGCYRTAETYSGKHGYSLRLDGLETGINDNARQRAIVIHAAKYVSEKFIVQHGRLGRSFGCPALPEAKTKPIINVIRNGACLFICANNTEYFQHSRLFIPEGSN